MNKSKKRGIFYMIAATSVECFGWGFADAFFSIFADGILNNLFFLGVLIAMRGIIALLVTIIGTQAMESTTPRNIAIFGKVVLIICAILYVLAGIHKSEGLLISAIVLNGIGQPLRVVANQGFLIAHVNKKNASVIMGIDFAVKNLLWILGIILSGLGLFFLGKIVHHDPLDVIHYGFIMLGLSCVVGIYLLENIPQKKIPNIFGDVRRIILNGRVFGNFFSGFNTFSMPLIFSLLLFFLIRLIETTVTLFIPLLAVKLNLAIWQVAILTASLFLPYVFSFIFSKMADRVERLSLIIVGLVLSVIPMIMLYFARAPIWIGVLSASIALCLAIIQPANLGMIASLASRSQKSRLAGLEVFFRKLGVIFGAFALGYIAEKWSLEVVFLVIAALSIAFAIAAVIIKLKIRASHKRPGINKRIRFSLHHILHHSRGHRL
jgi:MFS family permease